MMHLDRNALDGFLMGAGPAPGLPWGMAPVLAEVGEVPIPIPIPLMVEGHAGPSAVAAPPAEEEQDGAEEQTGGYALMVIEGAGATPSEVEVGGQEAVPSLVAEGANVAAAPAVPPSAEETEEILLPHRRRWPLMTAAGVALAGAAVLLALPAMRRANSTPATETATQEELSERAPVASAAQVPIPEPAPLAASAAPQALPRPQAEEAIHEMRFPGIFDRNSSHPHDIDAAALGDIVRLLRTRCVEGAIMIAGHTCALGDARSNRELSLLRARRVGELLVRAGFSPERLQIVGQGDRQPIADNRVIEGMRQNRRVTIGCDPSPSDHPR